MGHTRIYIGLFFLLTVIRTGFAQTTENYVKTYSARTANTTPSAVTTGNNSVSYKSFTYIDGLGRPKQTVKKQATFNSLDLITPVEYDGFGRQVKDYLPYAINGGASSGNFRSAAVTEQNSYYTSLFGSNPYGYSEKQYEASPLNRVDKQAAPGAAWRMTTGKEVKFSRRANQIGATGDSVMVLTVNALGLPVPGSLYSANSLWVETVLDEDNKATVHYIDKSGRIILKKVQNTALDTYKGHKGWLCTYYVYDDLDQLRVVIPPKAVEVIAAANWSETTSTGTTLANGLYFRYTYDSRGRMSEKRIPGKGAEYMLYDIQDRLVGFQDSIMRVSNKWLYTKYDGLGRLLMTGITVDATALATLQTTLGSSSNNAVVNSNSANIKTGSTITSAKYDGYNEYVATAGITLQDGFTFSANGDRTFTARIGTATSGAAGAWPTDEGEILTVNYYDSYQLLGGFSYVAPSGSYSGFDAQASTRTHGLQTGKKVKNLDTGQFFTTAFYYDKQGRVIQTLAQQQFGGYVRTSTSYNFENQPTQMLVANGSSVGQEVLRTYSYNVAGLLATITHKIGNQTAKTIAQNIYNDLGQLTSKSFSEIASGNQSYTYNIRGWLKTLGSSLSQGYKQTNYYESGGTAHNWNGNISRVDWTGRDGASKVRTYNYAYDKANRITAGTYSATGETNWFTVNGMMYDANGNITKLVRQNQRTASSYGVVDNLTYTYQTSSNRLNQVADGELTKGYTSKDFKEWGATAYGYDGNGNLTSSLDKQIQSITYNHLNLPAKVTFSTNASIVFSYDAEGTKLRQRVYNTSGALTKTQDYIGEYVYLDGALDYLIHEEGRVAVELGTYQYEYYLKDHLGNVRQVLRNPSSQVYLATMETQFAETEEQEFTQVQTSRQTEPEHNKTAGGNKVAWLNADRGRMVGPGRSQEIYAGDSLKLQVYGKYLDDKKQKANAGSFMAAGGAERLVADLNELALSTQRAGGANPIALLNLADILAKDLQKKEAPEAYLIYALYDQDSNRYEVGKKVLSKNAANQHEVLEEEMYISKDGYMETFVVNETAEDVWFDNMMVMSVSSVIVQETHYDPWGLELTGLGYQYGGIKANKYLYNGKELIEDNGLQYYDYGARMYDATIGRWGVVDPMADNSEQVDKSPYAFTWNNPINLVDPDGLKPLTDFVDINTGSISRIDDGKDQVIVASSETISQMQSLFDSDSEGYSTALGVLENSDENLNLTRGEFDFLAETVYAESSGGFEESLGIVNVLENRATNQGNSLMDQLSDKSPYGVYGIRKTGSSSYKYSYRNEKGAGANTKRANIHKAIAAGLTSATDVTNGAYFWDGRDFNGNSNVNGGYRARYEPGYLFTSPNHDLWGQGSKKVGETYKYQSTNAIGSTTFSKFYNQGTKWYIAK